VGVSASASIGMAKAVAAVLESIRVRARFAARIKDLEIRLGDLQSAYGHLLCDSSSADNSPGRFSVESLVGLSSPSDCDGVNKTEILGSIWPPPPLCGDFVGLCSRPSLRTSWASVKGGSAVFSLGFDCTDIAAATLRCLIRDVQKKLDVVRKLFAIFNALVDTHLSVSRASSVPVGFAVLQRHFFLTHGAHPPKANPSGLRGCV
jgi:hypothetical protein